MLTHFCRTDCAFRLPSFAEARPQSKEPDNAALILGPLGDAFNFAKGWDLCVASPIPALLFACSEAAIARTVSLVIIFALKLLCSIPALLHGPLFKCLKTIAPLRAHRNPASTIAPVSVIIRIEAAALHGCPDMVQRVSDGRIFNSARTPERFAVAFVRAKLSFLVEIFPLAKIEFGIALRASSIHHCIVPISEGLA